MNILPKARTENIVEQNLKQETLIYDLITNQAFNLNETLSSIYKACDGKTTFNDLKRKYKFSDDFIYLALDELKGSDLLAKDAVYHSPFAKTNRREVIKKVGLASMIMLPLIAGLVAPKAAHAASNTAGDSGDGSGGVRPYQQYGEYCNETYGPFCGDGGGLYCTYNRCCKHPGQEATSALLAGESFQVSGCNPNIYDDPPTVSGSCQDAGYNQRCCSGQVAGSCTQSSSVYDENGDIYTCNNPDGSTDFGFRVECNCTCL